MPDDFILEVKRFDTTDPRLGRHVLHDSRSRRYAAPAKDPRKLTSVRHTVNIPIMDQGNVGSCTGHAGTAAIASDVFWSGGAVVLQNQDPHEYAVDLYSEATRLDPWPGQYEPDDTGSDGLSIAKALQGRGLVSGYTHAFSLEAALTALAERVVLIGSSWLDEMYRVTAEGHVMVGGPVVGGHEFALDELDVERQRVWIRNSWGTSWGVEGRGWISWDELGRLLADDGDCTILTPVTQPAPVPQPVPDPQPEPNEVDRLLAGALLKILDNRNCPKYLRAPAEAWIASSKE